MRTPHALTIAALIASISAIPAQRSKKAVDWRTDPYTKGAPSALRKLGYESFGPFEWGDDHDSAKIDEQFGKAARIRWVETAHFRIGSTLQAFKRAGRGKLVKRRNAQLRDELGRLRRRLPGLAKRPKVLDPWLRLHLFAQRLEEMYGELEGLIAQAPRPKATRAGLESQGGFPPKFLVLLFSRRTEVERYVSHFLNDNSKQPKRWIFPRNGCPLFVTSSEFPTRDDDAALHEHVVFSLVHNMVDSYRGNYYLIPVWFPEGLAHFYSRRIDDAASNWSVGPRRTSDMHDPELTWAQLERKLAKAKTFTPFAKVMRWTSFDEMHFKDHIACWSRVSYLMTLEKMGIGTFLNGLKGQRDARGVTIKGPEVLVRQAKAFEAAWKTDAKGLDETWRAWVLSKRKPRKRRD